MIDRVGMVLNVSLSVLFKNAQEWKGMRDTAGEVNTMKVYTSIMRFSSVTIVTFQLSLYLYPCRCKKYK
jgi:hypothetical protein